MRALLFPFSLLFRIIVFIRNKLYDLGAFKTVRLNTKVISVGNVNTGGTGKTPLVEFLAEYFMNKNKLVVILNKGYKRMYDDIQVAELGYDNIELKLTTENIGDESLVLLENFPGNTQGRGLLIVSDDKTIGAKFAYRKFKPDILIIDDGFQHRKLSRDLDIVIVDENTKGMLLPAGNLREPVRNISRADIIILNHKFSHSDFKVKKKLKYRLSEGKYTIENFVNICNETIQLGNFNAAVFCGIGDPGSFRLLIERLGITIDRFFVFPDHHNYTIKDIKSILHGYKQSGSRFILTTQKDFVRIKFTKPGNSEIYRLKKEMLSDYPLYYAKIKLQISENKENIYETLSQLVK
jgi:tetraacyldisaccharide 4'-kinase